MIKAGDRVRMVQTDSCGTAVGDVLKGVGNDGTDRIAVKWDATGAINSWNPGFLRPAESSPTEDPDDVRVGGAGRRRDKVIIDKLGCTIVVPGGFYRVGV